VHLEQVACLEIDICQMQASCRTMFPTSACTASAREQLEKGANPNVTDWAGATPLQTAAVFGSTDVIQQLLAAGGDPNIADRWMPHPTQRLQVQQSQMFPSLCQHHMVSVCTPGFRSLSSLWLPHARAAMATRHWPVR
jgi:hypothetical protein